MLARILVPLAISQHACAALPVAITIARATNAELLLVTVDPHTVLYDRLTAFDGRELQEELEQHLARVSDTLRRQGFAAQHIVLRGNPAERIVEIARKRDVSLIVMATHGRATVGRWSHGSVADAIMRTAPVPVLLWHQPDRMAQDAPFQAQRILIPLDGTPGSEAIIPHAGWLAAITQAQISLLHVRSHAVHAHDSANTNASTHDLPQAIAALEADRIAARDAAATQASQAYLTSVIERHELVGATTITSFSDRHVHRAIIDVASREHIDVIAMATHGRSGFTRFVLGSITTHVLHSAEQPVLTLSLNPVPAEVPALSHGWEREYADAWRTSVTATPPRRRLQTVGSSV